jgi:hypothetical protein
MIMVRTNKTTFTSEVGQATQQPSPQCYYHLLNILSKLFIRKRRLSFRVHDILPKELSLTEASHI